MGLCRVSIKMPITRTAYNNDKNLRALIY
jgi:hypothetical protein